MKKTLPLYIICFLALFLFTGCKKRETTPIPNSPVIGMSYKVNGVPTESSYTVATMFVSTNQLVISSSSGMSGRGYPEISIQLKNPVIGVNTPFNLSYTESVNPQDFYSATVSQVTITSLTSTDVGGTFQCTCTNSLGNIAVTKNITEGVFYCSVTQQ